MEVDMKYVSIYSNNHLVTIRRNAMKKLVLTLTLLLAALFLSAQAAPESTDDTVMIGISQLMAHPALDNIEQGIRDALENEGVNAVFDTQNANGDVSTAASIAQLFRTENCDIVFGIATPTAQALANVFDDRPVVFATVTDVEAAGLSGLSNVCGSSDAVPFEEHFALIERLTGAQSIGMVYTAGEANGLASMEAMKAICEAAGVELVSASVSNSSEVRQAAQSIINRVDAVYVANDNTVISAVSSLSDVCLENSIPLFSADTTSSFDSDVFIACGFNYYKSGLLTGQIVKRLLDGESPEEIGTVYLTDLEYYINLDVADELGISVPEDIIENAVYLMRDGVNTAQ